MDQRDLIVAHLEEQVRYYMEMARHERNTGGYPGPGSYVDTARFFNTMLLLVKRGIKSTEERKK